MKHIEKEEADRLIINHLDFAKRCAAVFCRKYNNTDRDAIESAAMFGLVKAVDGYDPSRFAFSTYSKAIISDQMKQQRNKDWRLQNKKCGSTDVWSSDDSDLDIAPKKTTSVLQSDDHSQEVLDSLEFIPQMMELLEQQLKNDDQIQAYIMRVSGYKQYEIAEQLGVNPGTVSMWLDDARKILQSSISP